MATIISCPLCTRPIRPTEDYTVRVCCNIKYHAGCMHRRYVSGPRTCPKCTKGPSLSFDEVSGAIPSKITYEESLKQESRPEGLISRIIDTLSYHGPPQIKTSTQLIEILDSGTTFLQLKEEGLLKEDLINLRLDFQTVKKYQKDLKSVFGFDREDFIKIQQHQRLTEKNHENPEY